jgi:hypothetical protein
MDNMCVHSGGGGGVPWHHRAPPEVFPGLVILQGTVRSTRGDVIVGVTRSHTDTFTAAHVAPLV